jgi:protein-tyrosine phosphatase
MLIEDLPTFDIFSTFQLAHDFITAGRRSANVLVHCIVGASRSPTVVIAYLMNKWGMTLEDALAHLIAVRPIINPNVGFIQQLLEYELLLFKKVYSLLTHDLTFFYYVQQQNPRYTA